MNLQNATKMETRICNASAPVMPALWPSVQNIRPVRRRFPNTVDEPKSIGYYLEPLKGISSHPDRAEILKRYLTETIV